MTETAHEVQMIELAPGETIESYGYTPDDILTTQDASYERGDGLHTQRQILLRVWVMKEVEVDDE